MLTDFNDFWHKASRKNLTLVDCTFAYLLIANYSKNKNGSVFWGTVYRGTQYCAGCVYSQSRHQCDAADTAAAAEELARSKQI